MKKHLIRKWERGQSLLPEFSNGMPAKREITVIVADENEEVIFDCDLMDLVEAKIALLKATQQLGHRPTELMVSMTVRGVGGSKARAMGQTYMVQHPEPAPEDSDEEKGTTEAVTT